MSEIERIRTVYDERTRSGREGVWTMLDPANLYLLQRRERAIVELILRCGLEPLGNKRIIDVGCGNGSVLGDFVRFGAEPSLMAGVDLLEERIEIARERYPAIEFTAGSAEELPYPAESFDIALQFTVLSSVLDDGVRQRITAETMRVLRSGGTLIWYDFIWNPTNRDVRGIALPALRTLYPGCEIDVRRVTLAPPVSRRLTRLSWTAARLVEALPFLRSHYLAAVQKPSNVM